MGRMLDTLKQSEGRRAMPAAGKPSGDAAVQDCVVDWEIGDEVPFVEVGGPNKKVELSPGLVVHPAQPAPRPPHHVVDKTQTAAPNAIQLTPTPPMGVTYQAWPGAAAASGNVGAEVIAFHQPEHPTSKEYAGLLDAMLQGLKGGRIVLLVGQKTNVGASTVLLNLAAVAGMARKLRVVLVEANHQDAGLAQRLGQASAAGLDAVVAGTLGLEQAVVHTTLPAVDLLPAGEAKLSYKAEAVNWLMAWLRERYDLILIDGPTLDDTASLSVLAPQANGAYLVLPRGDANAGAAQAVGRLGGRLCGLIHTHFDA